MPKKPIVITVTDSQHVKGSKTLHDSPRQYFSHIFWSLWKDITLQNSVLLASEILRHFVKILTPDDKRSLLVKGSV